MRATIIEIFAVGVAIAIVMALILVNWSEGRLTYGQSQTLGVGVVGTSHILDGAILNADINASSNIAWTKILSASGSIADLGTRNFSDTTGTVSVARGGTGAATLTANNVVLGNGTSAVAFVAPGADNNYLRSNGTTWISEAVSSAPPVLIQFRSSESNGTSTGYTSGMPSPMVMGCSNFPDAATSTGWGLFHYPSGLTLATTSLLHHGNDDSGTENYFVQIDFGSWVDASATAIVDTTGYVQVDGGIASVTANVFNLATTSFDGLTAGSTYLVTISRAGTHGSDSSNNSVCFQGLLFTF